MSVLYYYRCLIVCILLGLTGANASAQTRDTSEKDTVLTEDFVTRSTRISKQTQLRNVSKFEIEKVSIIQNEIIESVKKTTQKAKAYLKTGIDTLAIQQVFETIESKFYIAGDGVFINTGTAQTYRNLSTTHKILNELSNRAKSEKNLLDNYQKNLANYIFTIDSLSSNSNLYVLPQDSLSLSNYLQKVNEIINDISPVDSLLKQAIVSVRGLQKRVNADVNKLESNKEQIERYQQNLSTKIFEREFNNLGDGIGYVRPFHEIIHISIVKAEIILLFYAQNNWGKILFSIILIYLVYLFLKSLKRILKENVELYSNFNSLLVLRYPVLSAILIVLNTVQFIFPDPPFIFSSIFWIISALSLAVIFGNYVSIYWKRIWLAILFLFLLCCLDNYILQASRLERIGMFILQLAGVLTGAFILFKGYEHKRELREKSIIFFIGFMAVLELAALIFNFYGRYNISKTLQTAGYTNVVIGILFLWTIRLLDEILSVTYKVYIGKQKKWLYINFEEIGEKTPPFLYVMLGFGWTVLFGRNFYEFRLLTDPFKTFLYSDRTIGNYTYSVSNLLVFVVIIGTSVILSKLVSFFAADKYHLSRFSKKGRKPGVGSYVLLIRVFILAAGILLAFAAVGLPMARITLIISALGVGIGFGLQTLVNNLVSGLIIAFEKPVNVGDIVEINGQSGVVKSIGFRSSIIARGEGGDIVIPNGDLLNAHLINWTLGGNKMRVDILLHAAYNADLNEVRSIINGILEKADRVLKYPSQSVLFKEFSNNSVEIKISFWVNDYNISSSVKSDVVYAIDTAFKENGITIPVPQQEIHIRTQPDVDEKKKEEN